MEKERRIYSVTWVSITSWCFFFSYASFRGGGSGGVDGKAKADWAHPPHQPKWRIDKEIQSVSSSDKVENKLILNAT